MVFGMGGGGNELEVVVTSDTSGFTSGIDQAISRIDSFNAAVAGIGAGVSLAGVKIIKEAVDASREMERVQKDLARVMPTAEAEAMVGRVNDMSREIPLATEEIGRLAAEAAQFGIRGEESITNFTETVAMFARATDMSTDQAGKAFARMINQMQLSEDEVGNLGSAINELANNFATSTTEITKGVLKSAATLTNLGMKRTDIVALNAALQDSGVSASVAGRGMRRLGQEMLDPRKTADLAGALGMNVDQFKAMREKDPTKLLMLMASTMGEGGENAEILGSTLSSFSQRVLTNLAGNQETVNEALGMSADAFEENTSLAEEYETVTGTLADTKQILANNVGILLGHIGDQFVPIFKAAGEVVVGLSDAAASLDSELVGTVGAVLSVSMVVGGAIAAFAALNTMMGGAMVAAAGTFIAAFGTVAVIVGTVAAAIAGLAMAWKTNFAGIQDSTAVVLNTVRTEFDKTLPYLNRLVDNVLGDIVSAWTENSGQVENIVGEHLGRLTTKIHEGLRGVGDSTRRALALANKWWFEHRDQVMQSVAQIATTIQTTLVTAIGAIEAVVNRVRGVWNSLDATHKKMIGSFAGVAAAAIVLGPTILSVVASLTGLIGTATTAVSSFGTLIGVAKTAVGAYLSFGTTIVGVVTKVVSFGSAIMGVIPSLLSMATTVMSLIGTAVSFGSTILGLLAPLTSFSGIVGIISTAIGALSGIFLGVIGVITGTIIPGIFSLLAAFTSLSGIIGIVTTVVGSVGPALLTLAGPIGVAIALAIGLYAAFQANFLGIKDIVNTVMKFVKAVIRGDMEEAKGIVGNATAAIMGFWDQHIVPLIALTKKVFNQIVTVIKNVMTFIWKNVIQPILGQILRLWEIHGDKLIAELRATFKVAKSAFNDFVDFIVPIIEWALDFIMGLWNAWGDEIITVVKFVFDLIISTAGAFADALISAFRLLMAIVRQDWETAWDIIAGFFERLLTGMLDFAVKWGGRFLDWLGGVLSDALQAFIDWANDLFHGSVIKDLFNGIKDFLEDIWGKILDFLKKVLGKIKKAVKEKFEEAKRQIEEKVEAAYERLKHWFGEMLSKVKDILGNIIDKITNWNLPTKIGNKAHSAYKKFKRKFDISGAVSSALSSAQRKIDNWTPDWPDLSPPNVSGSGDSSSGRNLQGSRHGDYIPAGVVTPRLLHGPEHIVPSDQLRQMFTSAAAVGAAASRGGDGRTVHVENLYTQAQTRAQARQVKDELKAALRSENF